MISGTFPRWRLNYIQKPLVSRPPAGVELRTADPAAGQWTMALSVSDEDLLRRSADGDEEAFTALYRRRQGGIYRFALHMSGCSHIAEEATQEVFLALIREPGKFDASRGPLSAFLYGIARNQVLRMLNRGRAFVAIDDDAAQELPAAECDVLQGMTEAESIEAVRQAVLSLPGNYREVVVLCDLEEMSYADVAAILGTPVGTVRSRLNRGRGLLEEKLRAGRQKSMRCSV